MLAKILLFQNVFRYLV